VRLISCVTMVSVPIKFSHMPKSSKRQREDQMELFVPIYILEDACDKETREKFIAQWLGLGAKDHDDGPDSLSRLIRYATRQPYRKPVEQQAAQQIQVVNGAAHVPFAMIKAAAKPPTHGGTWGQQGGVPRCGNCGAMHPGSDCNYREGRRAS